ncbi:uncharacterized protein RAG0_00011 [Rhynchosporium agropyri]|uniref:RING-type domain-containing protein n=1 Tax=Rhynchosporium agropyri TaxID=914238 RepID=A0A1E1JR99_9HELO|nr:uncharacterized protein RAG0_00011 [Rhynchosporium agropyri]
MAIFMTKPTPTPPETKLFAPNYNLGPSQRPYRKDVLLLFPTTDDLNSFAKDTSKFMSPRMRLVPRGELVLDEQEVCAICFGIFHTSPENIINGCTGRKAVMLPCGHIFGQVSIAETFEKLCPCCPLCTRKYKIRYPNTDRVNELRSEIVEDKSLGPWIYRFLIMVSLRPLFTVVDAIMVCGQHMGPRKEFIATWESMIEDTMLQFLIFISTVFFVVKFSLQWSAVILNINRSRNIFDRVWNRVQNLVVDGINRAN